jgi:hypothetical protein
MELFSELADIHQLGVEPSQCGKFIPNWRSYYMQHCCPESDVELIAES